MATRSKRSRWLALGLVVGLGLAWGGYSVAESAPSSITTCTKNSNNKTKVITTAQVAKCTRKGKGVVQSWVPASQLATANKYYELLTALQNGPAVHDFRNMYLVNVRLNGDLIGPDADFRNANFTNASIQDTIFYPTVDLRNANFTGVDFSGSTLPANFAGANFTDTVFSGNPSVNLSGGNFAGTNFTNAWFDDGPLWPANLTSANFQNANFTDANLRYADLTGANVSGVIWNNTTCPNGVNSNDAPNCAGQGGGL
jgi:uncharacterized protein YjbI with pentapeptide repeats